MSAPDFSAISEAVAAITLEAAARADNWAGKSVYHCALQCLLESDPLAKAALTFEVCAAYERGLLSLDVAAPPRAGEVPSKPGRPSTVKEVHPAKVKNSGKKHMLHALVHAESYAGDLAWDIIARFAYNPASWGWPRDAAVPAATVPAATEGSVAPSTSASEAAATSSSTSDAIPTSDADGSDKRLPKAFFDDWIRVAAEEAKHFSKWRLRLAELGHSYGDFPAHDGLWQSAEETSSHLMARLAIVHCVHEARGLDTYTPMMTKLSAGDDKASVAILIANHAEEIGHVDAGRRWLEWCCSRLQVQRGSDGVSTIVEAAPAVSSKGASVDAADGGDVACTALSPIPAYHSLVRRYFHGALRPPFNEVSRSKAGFTPEWYLPLQAAPAAGAGPAVEQELSAEDMG